MLPRTLGRDRRALTLRATLAVVLSVVLVGAALPAAADQTAVTETSLDAAASLPVDTMPTDAAVADTAVSQAAVADSAVQPAYLTGFNPSNLISDALFYDGGAMSSAQIQRFLEQRVSSCGNNRCIRNLRASISSRSTLRSQATGNLVCNAIPGGSNLRISEIIYRVQKACGISAKVILTTLQKEQGVVTNRAPSAWNIQQAMGAYCPDTSPCDPRFSGIGAQIVTGTIQMKMYKAGRFAKQPGTHFIGWHPNSACGGRTITVSNYATAALYSYTPYQPNAAALRAGWGEGDGCSSYGNRNFYNYYTSWFGSTQGAPANTCAAPVGARSAFKTYVVDSSSITARKAPRSGCNSGSEKLARGAVLQATQVSASGNWLQVHVEDRDLWILRDEVRYATSSESACAMPSADSAKLTYVVTGSVSARVAPSTECTPGAVDVSSGTVGTAVAVTEDREWIKLVFSTGHRWLPRDDVRYASSKEEVCALPTDMRSAQRSYAVLPGGTTARTAPSSQCGKGTVDLRTGATFSATGVDGDTDWLMFRTSSGRDVWVPRDEVDYASSFEACDPGAKVDPAVKTYVVAGESVIARTAPSVACDAGAVDAEAGTAVEAVAVTEERDWIKLAFTEGDRWVPRDEVRYASSSEAVCASPAAASAKLTYVVTSAVSARTAPSTKCSSGAVDVAAGTVATAVAVTDDRQWLKLAFSQGERWVARDKVRYAASAEATCAVPTDFRDAQLAYVVMPGGTTARTAPSSACDSAPIDLRAGASFTATGVDAGKGWLMFRTSGGRDVWVPREDVDYASSTNVCELGGRIDAAMKTYVVSADGVVGRSAPSIGCSNGAADIAAGTVGAAVAVTAERDWIKLAFATGEKWVPRDQVRYATSAEAGCTTPAGVGSAKLTYVVLTGGSVARPGPSLDCAAGTVELSAGAVLTATGVTAEKDWLRFRSDGRDVWIPRADVDYR